MRGRWSTLVSIFAIAILAGSAAAAEPVLWARLGGIGQGPQGTFKKGWEAAIGADAVRAGATSLGLGFAWVREPDRRSYTQYEGTMWTVEAHARSALLSTRLQPVLELGIAYSRLRLESQRLPNPPELHEANGPGGIVGAGLEVPVTGRLRVSAEARYHVIVTGVSAWGSSSEDYFSIGGTLRTPLTRR